MKWRTLILGLTTALIIGSLFNLTPTYCWPLEVNRNLGLYYLLAHALSVPLLVTLIGRVSALRLYLLVCLNFALAANYLFDLLPFYLGASPKAAAHAAVHRVLYANVNHWNTNYDALRKIIEENNPALIALVEPGEEWGAALSLRARYPYYKEIFNGTPFGMALYSQYPFVDEMVLSLGHPLPPVIVTNIELPQGRKIGVALLHTRPPVNAHNVRENRLIVRRMASLLRGMHADLLLVSDLNAAPFSTLYQKFVEWTAVVNAAHGRGLIASWNARSRWLRFSIDHIFVRGALAVQDLRRLPAFGSDHYPLLLDFVMAD